MRRVARPLSALVMLLAAPLWGACTSSKTHSTGEAGTAGQGGEICLQTPSSSAASMSTTLCESPGSWKSEGV
jgi:hypothetical protein